MPLSRRGGFRTTWGDYPCTASRGVVATFDDGTEVCVQRTTGLINDQRENYADYLNVRPDVLRQHLWISGVYNMSDHSQLYTENLIYSARTVSQYHPSAFLGAGMRSQLSFAATNYWYQQLLKQVSWLAEEERMIFKYFRFSRPRTSDIKEVYVRSVQGMNGVLGNWSWDTALMWQTNKYHQDNGNRVSANRFEEVLSDSTPAAYNPFCARELCNSEELLDSLYMTIWRKQSQSSIELDGKASTKNLYSLPYGNVQYTATASVISETLKHLRDPRINGTIAHVRPLDGATYPYISDVHNSSPSPDMNTQRTTLSFFHELKIPLLSNVCLDYDGSLQKATRYDPQTAHSIQLHAAPLRWLDVTAGVGTSYEFPNLEIEAGKDNSLIRSNTQTDALFTYLGFSENSYSMQRDGVTSESIQAARSVKKTYGLVLKPMKNSNVYFQNFEIKERGTFKIAGVDYWSEKDLELRLSSPGGCEGSTNVIRESADTLDAASQAVFADAGICPVGRILRINDVTTNLASTVTQGYNIGGELRMNLDQLFLSRILKAKESKLNVRFDGTVYRKQDFTFDGQTSSAKGADGMIPKRYAYMVSYSNTLVSLDLSGTHKDAFLETGHTGNANGAPRPYEVWVVKSMNVVNAAIGIKPVEGLEVKFKIDNFKDARAPLADEYWGNMWNNAAHQPFGRGYALQLKWTQ